MHVTGQYGNRGSNWDSLQVEGWMISIKRTRAVYLILAGLFTCDRENLTKERLEQVPRQSGLLYANKPSELIWAQIHIPLFERKS